jgi:quercetin dioxygenase-like cupin family protein
VPARGVHLPAGGGHRISSPLAGEIVFKARGEETGGALTVFEAVNPPGQGPPLHVHAALDEFIYVLDGEFRIRLGDRVQDATTGAFVFIPRGTPHTWQVSADTPSRFLAVLAPAGLEGFFTDVAASGEGTNDPFTAFGRDDLTVVGPPLAQTHPP